MKRAQSILVSSVLIASITAFGLGWFFAKNIDTETPNANPNIFQTAASGSTTNIEPLTVPDLDEVWAILNDSYYDNSKLEASKLKYGAVKGFVAEIGDPYTVFMTPDESKEFEDGLEGQLEGIGAELEVKNGKLIVVSPLKNSPAQQAGIRSGDIIAKIDGKLAAEMTFYDAVHKIRGKKGTQVNLTIIRESLAKPLEIKITRSEIQTDSITLEKLPDNIFHLSINQFNEHTKTQYENAIQKILLEKAKGLILDMRGNGGGYLDVSIEILSELLPGKQTAVIIKKRNEKDDAIKTIGGSRLADIPLAVLINNGSASASEIVAGAIQDYKRGILIGEKTFGKGSVQEIEKLNDGATIRMTIAKWFTPLNRSIDEVGIAPDKEVKITEEDINQKLDPQLDEAVNYLKNSRL